MPPLDPRCPLCGGAITQDGPPTRCPWCGAKLAPPPLDEAIPLPDDAFDEVPVVRTVAKSAPLEDLPEARPLPAKRVVFEPPRPEPKIGLALLVVFAMVVAIGCALSVIVVALWMGFQSVAKPRKGEVSPAGSRAVAPALRFAVATTTFQSLAHAPPSVEVC